jgi:hypothetical protein
MIWALITIAVLVVALFVVLILWSITAMAVVKAETELRILKEYEEGYPEEVVFNNLDQSCNCSQCESQPIIHGQTRND